MINMERLVDVAKVLNSQPESDGLNFYSYNVAGNEIVATDMYPALDDSQVVNFFFFVCLHQYGFWYGSPSGYLEPMIGTIHGKAAKGSDLLWKMCKAALDRDHDVFEPARLRKLTPRELATIFSDDNGPVPFPDFDIRLQLSIAYGSSSLFREATPHELVCDANESSNPLRYFLRSIRDIPGYDQDPLQKKQLLLAMVLANRPEKFLRVSDDDSWKPIVDYHLMRLCLRLGIVVPESPGDAARLKNRQWVTVAEEQMIRKETYDAVEMLVKLSGKSMSFVDEKMWEARRYCPEMEAPDCANCPLASACEKNTEFFQPVFRTTAY